MPKTAKRTVRTRKGVREYTYLGCPLTRNRTAWCFRLCVPDSEGRGECGRLAPHGMKSRTQMAIEAHNLKERQARAEALESAYLAAPENALYDPGVRVLGGEAEIVLPLEPHDGKAKEDEGGPVPAVLCFKAMHDSAHLAVGSLLKSGHLDTEEFTVKLTGIPGSGALVARSLFVGMSEDRYLTEAVLTDVESQEIGRGRGVFAVKA